MRNIHIDLLKGFAIILVVLGYSVQFLSNNDLDNPLFNFIYAFHMPLFMFLSGYVCFKSQGEKHINLKKRFSTLIVPFFVWWIVGNIISVFLGEETISLKTLLQEPDHGRWFLWVLFFLCVFLQISFIITKKYEEVIMLLITIFLLFIVRLLYSNILGIPLMTWHIVFFSFGYIFHKYETFFIPYRHFLGITSILVFSIGVPFWHFTITPYTFLENYSLPLPLENKLYLLYKYFVPFSGILSFYYIFSFLSYQKLLSKILLLLAPITLEIYVIHYYFLYVLCFLFSKFNHINLYLQVFFSVPTALIGSYLIQKLISKNKYINKILFGK